MASMSSWLMSWPLTMRSWSIWNMKYQGLVKALLMALSLSRSVPTVALHYSSSPATSLMIEPRSSTA